MTECGREWWADADEHFCTIDVGHEGDHGCFCGDRLPRRVSRCPQCDGHGEWGYSPESLHTCEVCGGSGQEARPALEDDPREGQDWDWGNPR